MLRPFQSISNPTFYLMEKPSVFLEVHVTHTRLLTSDVGLSRLDDMVARLGNCTVIGCAWMMDTRILTVFGDHPLQPLHLFDPLHRWIDSRVGLGSVDVEMTAAVSFG
jgi:hypothetical protein